MKGNTVNRIPMAFEPAHLDYIVAVLRRCPWENANPILVDIQQQAQQPQQPTTVDAQPNGLEHVHYPNGGAQAMPGD
jgi:hypothetical protein